MNSTPGEGYVIPWRTVYNSSSLSTPCRMVYDASARTSSGHSLNSTLAKGQNRLARLVDLFIRFRRGKVAVTADINSERLNNWANKHIFNLSVGLGQ